MFHIRELKRHFVVVVISVCGCLGREFAREGIVARNKSLADYRHRFDCGPLCSVWQSQQGNHQGMLGRSAVCRNNVVHVVHVVIITFCLASNFGNGKV